VGGVVAYGGSGFYAGTTASPVQPLVNALYPDQPFEDGFIMRMSPSGSILYSTYLGGNLRDTIGGIAVNATGIYVAGGTTSSDFPAQGPAAGGSDIFVAKISLAGSSLIYSKRIGGSASDFAKAIAINNSGAVFVAGSTTSPNFPVANAFQRLPGGQGDAFFLRLSPAAVLSHATYLGGSGIDFANRIVLDAAGQVTIAGSTRSANFPVFGALQPLRGPADAFVTRFNADMRTLTFSTYLGGSAVDEAQDLGVDNTGALYIAGNTSSSDFPTTPGSLRPQDPSPSEGNGFLVKLQPAGSVTYSTYVGPGPLSTGNAVAVDANGAVYVGGRNTVSAPLSAFVTKLTPSEAHIYTTTYPPGYVTRIAVATSTLPLGVPTNQLYLALNVGIIGFMGLAEDDVFQ
jgi:hypothetical protein